MRVLVYFTDKHDLLLCCPNVTRRSVVESRTWFILLFWRRLGHSGIFGGVKINYLVFLAMRMLRAMLKK